MSVLIEDPAEDFDDPTTDEGASVSSGEMSGFVYRLVRKSSRGVTIAVLELALLFSGSADSIEDASDGLSYRLRMTGQRARTRVPYNRGRLLNEGHG